MSTATHRTLALLAAFAATVAPAWARADPFETRTYLDVAAEGLPAPAPHVNLAPFVREESRFRDGGLIYVKASAGARGRVRPWLRAAAYYGHQDLHASGQRQAHMAALDVFVAPKLGPFVVSDKSGFEAHLTNEFFRYRNALEIRWESPLGWLAPFALGEVRVDSDAARVNLLDAWTGAVLRLSHEARAKLSLRAFYGYETTRRRRSEWSGVHLLGAALSARF